MAAYFVENSKIQEHNELVSTGKSIDHLMAWGRPLKDTEYEIKDKQVIFIGTYRMSYKACIESKNYQFVYTEDVQKVETKVKEVETKSEVVETVETIETIETVEQEAEQTIEASETETDLFTTQSVDVAKPKRGRPYQK